MRKQVFTAFSIVPLLFISTSLKAQTNSLDTFLNSDKLEERKAAYLDILANKEAYIDQIHYELDFIQRTKDKRYRTFNKLTYLAAIIRNVRFIDPLWKMLDDIDYLDSECIYCCPILFALTLYALYTDWSPPDDILAYELQKEISREKEKIDVPLYRKTSGVQYASPEWQDWLRKTELLSVEELIKMTGPENPNNTIRHNSASVLAPAVTDDKFLVELYWLAIEELVRDASGIYRCDIFEAILRAERARAQKDCPMPQLEKEIEAAYSVYMQNPRDREKALQFRVCKKRGEILQD
jgi:hypothetical protein